MYDTHREVTNHYSAGGKDLCWALQQFTTITNHNPLILILNSHCLNEIENHKIENTSFQIYGIQLYSSMVQKGATNIAYPTTPYGNLTQQTHWLSMM